METHWTIRLLEMIVSNMVLIFQCVVVKRSKKLCTSQRKMLVS